MIFVEQRSGLDRRNIVPSNLVPDKEKRSNKVGGRRITDRLEKIKIDPNDFLIFKIYSMTDAVKTSALEITKHIRRKGGFVVFTLPNVDVEKIPESQMNKLGWYRKDNDTK